MPDEFEARVAHEMRDVFPATREKVVQADDRVSLLEQQIAQVRAEKPRSAGDQHLSGMQ